MDGLWSVSNIGLRDFLRGLIELRQDGITKSELSIISDYSKIEDMSTDAEILRYYRYCDRLSHASLDQPPETLSQVWCYQIFVLAYYHEGKSGPQSIMTLVTINLITV